MRANDVKYHDPTTTVQNNNNKHDAKIRAQLYGPIKGVLYVVSLFQFHGTKLFEMTAEMATIRTQLYGRTKLVRPYSWPLDLLEAPFAVGFLLELLVNSKLTIFLVLGSFSLRHDWSKNYVHCIHHMS